MIFFEMRLLSEIPNVRMSQFLYLKKVRQVHNASQMRTAC